jgi:hypothetical protein
MEPLPTLEGTGHVYVCPSCPDQAPINASSELSESQTDASERFRSLLKEAEEHKDDSVPLDELPEEAKRLLKRKSETGSFRKETIESLRDRGFVIDEDVHGQRISGMPYSSRGDSGQLSPSEVVRMALELEGGAISPDDQIKCSNCSAVVSAKQEKCPWCDQPLHSSD